MKSRAVMAILLAIAAGAVTSVAVAETGAGGEEVWCKVYPNERCYSNCSGGPGTQCWTLNQLNTDPPPNN